MLWPYGGTHPRCGARHLTTVPKHCKSQCGLHFSVSAQGSQDKRRTRGDDLRLQRAQYPAPHTPFCLLHHAPHSRPTASYGFPSAVAPSRCLCCPADPGLPPPAGVAAEARMQVCANKPMLRTNRQVTTPRLQALTIHGQTSTQRAPLRVHLCGSLNYTFPESASLNITSSFERVYSHYVITHATKHNAALQVSMNLICDVRTKVQTCIINIYLALYTGRTVCS